jgi:serine protease Do
MKHAWNQTLIVAFSAGALVVSGITWSQRQEAAAVGPLKSAQDLSVSFRHVAKEVTPSVVSIATKSKQREVTMQENPFLDENSPFGDFFRNDPRFKDLFRSNPGLKRRIPQQQGMGSGFVIDESGVIMTNNHVVRDADEVVVTLHDGQKFIAKDIKTDPRTDVAILRIEGAKNLKAAKLGNSHDMEVGDWVVAVGSPFGYDLTVTAGIISAKGRGIGAVEREDFLQTDAAINPGNSGGPLLNLDGEVIGINTAISSRSGGYEGIGFAIPIHIAGWVGDQLAKTGSVKRGYLGIRNGPVTDELAKTFNVNAREGVIVGAVLADSPAERAGLEPNDVILSINGKKVNDPKEIQQLVERLDTGKPYAMHIIRDGKPKELTVTIEEMPENFGAPKQGGESQSPSGKKFNDLGLELRALTADLAKQLGFKTDKGVVVTGVKEDGPAAQAGVRQGDLIEKVGTVAVSTVEDFQNAVKEHSLKDGIVLHLRTEEGKRFVIVKDVDEE